MSAIAKGSKRRGGVKMRKDCQSMDFFFFFGMTGWGWGGGGSVNDRLSGKKESTSHERRTRPSSRACSNRIHITPSSWTQNPSHDLNPRPKRPKMCHSHLTMPIMPPPGQRTRSHIHGNCNRSVERQPTRHMTCPEPTPARVAVWTPLKRCECRAARSPAGWTGRGRG